MHITTAELYNQYYSASRNLYRGDTNMPNHCHNRVTFYSANTDAVAKLKQIFEDENCFTQIIPEPDWHNTPLISSEVSNFGRDRGKVGELPQYVEDYAKRLVFKSTGHADDRWYDWRVNHWGTKWDAYDVVVTDDDPESVEIEFNTAWSPPEPICAAIRDEYPDVSVSWFYDEPGCEIAGYL